MTVPRIIWMQLVNFMEIFVAIKRLQQIEVLLHSHQIPAVPVDVGFYPK